MKDLKTKTEESTRLAYTDWVVRGTKDKDDVNRRDSVYYYESMKRFLGRRDVC